MKGFGTELVMGVRAQAGTQTIPIQNPNPLVHGIHMYLMCT